MSRRRVVITGLGPVTAHGNGIAPLWDALCEGRSALAPIRVFDARGFRAASGAQLPDSFDVKEFVPKSYRKATKVMARDIEIAVIGAHCAVKDAGLITRGTDPEHAAHARVRIQTRQWLAEKWKPSVYGTKQAQIQVNIHSMRMDALRHAEVIEAELSTGQDK